jgi:hypothetical protein
MFKVYRIFEIFKRDYVLDCPLFDVKPLPKFYILKNNSQQLNHDSSMNQLIDQSSFNYDHVSKSDETQLKWLNKIRNSYLDCIKSGRSCFLIKNNDQILMQIVFVLLKNESNSLIRQIDSKSKKRLVILS